MGGALDQVGRDWKELYIGNVISWLPFNVVIYGAIPVNYQVLAFSGFTVLYTIFLSVWIEARMALRQLPAE